MWVRLVAVLVAIPLATGVALPLDGQTVGEDAIVAIEADRDLQPPRSLVEILRHLDRDSLLAITSPWAPTPLRNLALLNGFAPASYGTAPEAGPSPRAAAAEIVGLEHRWSTAFTGLPYGHTLADLDGDGVSEYVAGTSLGVAAMNLEGSFRWARVDDAFTYNIAATDADEDGDDEILVASAAWNHGLLQLLDGDGSMRWNYTTDNIVIAAAPTAGPGSDILATDFEGNVLTFEAATGKLLASHPGPQIPEASQSSLYIRSSYTYAAAFLDVDGDGDDEMVTARAAYAGAVVDTSGTILGVSDSDGVLWETYLTTPPSATFAYHFVTALGAVDASGDGKMDVAVASFGYHDLAFMSSTHVFAGDAEGTADPLFHHVTEGALDRYEYTLALGDGDLDGDAARELGVLRWNSALGPSEHRSAFGAYATREDASGQETGMVVEAELLGLDGLLAGWNLQTPDGPATAALVIGASSLELVLVAADGTVSERIDVGQEQPYWVAFVDGRLFVSGTDGAGYLDGARARLRGEPSAIAPWDIDGDAVSDFLVLAQDGVHALRGRDGAFLEVPKALESDPVLSVWRVHEDLLQIRRYEIKSGDTYLEGLNAGLKALYRIDEADRYWYDTLRADVNGDGVPDFVYDYDSSTRRFLAADGATGVVLWQSEALPDDFYTIDTLRAATLALPGEDLVVRNNRDLVAMDGVTGKVLWTIESEYSDWDVCASGALETQSGTVYGELVEAYKIPTQIQLYGGEGALESVLVFAGTENLRDCWLASVGTHALAAISVSGGTATRIERLQLGDGSRVWATTHPYDERDSAPAFSIDAGTLLVRDHAGIRLLDVEDGTAQGSVSVPASVTAAARVQMDGHEAIETVLIYNGGIVAVLSAPGAPPFPEPVAPEDEATTVLAPVDDPLVTSNEGPEASHSDPKAKKKSPGLGALLIGALILVARRRR